ncbi:MAG: hypothetical protein AAF840_01865 [Bacteroidota bacterium]
MYIFQKKSLFFFLALSLMLAFTSCEDEFTQEEAIPELITEEEMPELLNKALPPDPETTENDPAAARRTPCFRFVFPIQIALRNGTIITANDAQDLRAAYRRIREAGARANFVYPFDIVLANGNQVTVENFRTIRRIHNRCRDVRDQPHEPCIAINFPIEVRSGDTIFTVSSPQEYREANQAFRPRGVAIVFPIDVTILRSGRVVSVDGARQLARLRNLCVDRGDDDDREPCYSVLFPVTLNINGDEVMVMSREEWRAAVAEAGEDADVSLVFPITIVNLETEEEVSVGSLEDWRAARELCE